MKRAKATILLLSVFFLIAQFSFSQNNLNSKFEKIVFGCYTSNIKEFEDFVIRAKKSGATHINLSNEDLPFAKWEYDVEGDPYPSWVFTNMGLLKIATPEILKKYLPQDYSESVFSILEARCKVLRKFGLKAAFKTFEPQMLPEKVYEDYPLWRGPRVDHPCRSRVPRWAPDIDNPEVLQLYKEAFAILLKRCPEIEIMSLTTNDSGTGLSWSGGLYSGATGNTVNKYRSTAERISSFFSVFMEVAKNIGVNLEVDFYGTREEFPKQIAVKLTPGMAIENLEGPDAKPFKAEVGFVMDYYQILYPVVGIPDPVGFSNEIRYAYNSGAKRLFVLFGDRFNKDLYFNIYDSFNLNPPNGELLSQLQFLRSVAVEQVEEQNADQLLKLWLNIQDARKPLELLNSGGTIFYLGGVSQRWLTRPFLPFPEDLKPQDRDYFRKFQFQALTEIQANDMADLQATRVFTGMSGRFFVSRVIDNVKNSIRQARNATSSLINSNLKAEQIKEYKLLDLRLKAFTLICNNSKNAISYQAQLEKAKTNKNTPELRPDIGTPSSWERSLILETAREEIDNTALLIQLLESTKDPILDLALTPEQEDIRRLGSDFKNQLHRKLKIMNEHWLDYNRIFTIPNK